MHALMMEQQRLWKHKEIFACSFCPLPLRSCTMQHNWAPGLRQMHPIQTSLNGNYSNSSTTPLMTTKAMHYGTFPGGHLVRLQVEAQYVVHCHCLANLHLLWTESAKLLLGRLASDKSSHT